MINPSLDIYKRLCSTDFLISSTLFWRANKYFSAPMRWHSTFSTSDIFFLPSHNRLLNSLGVLLERYIVPPFAGIQIFYGPLAYVARQGALIVTTPTMKFLPLSSTSLLGGLAFPSSSFKSITSPTLGGGVGNCY